MIKDTAARCRDARSLLPRPGLGWIDPYFHWTRWRMGRAREKSLWMSGIGSGEHGRPRSDASLGQAVMRVGGCQQPEARMMMLSVVPDEERVAVRPSILNRAETRRKCRAILERLELRF